MANQDSGDPYPSNTLAHLVQDPQRFNPNKHKPFKVIVDKEQYIRRHPWDHLDMDQLDSSSLKISSIAQVHFCSIF